MELFDDAIPGPTTRELPIVDYNHLPRLTVESRAKDLNREQLELVLRYEREHSDRTPVIQLLNGRLRQLRLLRRGAVLPPGGPGPAPHDTRP